MINNSSVAAVIDAQKAFKGATRDFCVKSEEDVQKIIDEVRYSKKKR